MSVLGPSPRGRVTSTLRHRLVLMAGLVALASVLITGIAMFGLFRAGATQSAQAALGRDADTVSSTVAGISDRGARRQLLRTAALSKNLARRQITLAVIPDPSAPGTLTAPFTSADVANVAAGRPVSRTAQVDGTTWLIEGRLGGPDVVLLAQPQTTAVAENRLARRRLVLPLVLGLFGGGLAGGLMAGQLSRPMSALVAAARTMSAGHRNVRVPEDGPAEIAELATALNGLAAALESSEERQRRFLTDVSHELRTPLTAVSGYAEGLALGDLTGADVVPAAQVIQAEAARLGRRVDDLLALARMEAEDFRLELAPADLAALMRAAELAWRPRAAAAGVQLAIDVPPQPLIVTTDAERLRQAVDALTDNGLRVLAPGSQLVLGCGRDERRAWISVSDNGPGLAPDDLAVAFERGRLTERYRADRPVGSGLGLALVGELARRLGGSAVATAPAAGPGVTFAVLLPV